MAQECKATVTPGVCRLNTVIIAKLSDDMMNVSYEVESECENVKAYAEKLGTLNPYEIMDKPMIETPMYKATCGTIPHAACPVPCAVVKATEASAGLALKRDVDIKLE